MKLNIVVLGLSITSSWGNGHATTYRGLIKALRARGHRITFLERDVVWYRDHRDLPKPSYCRVHLYNSLVALRRSHADLIARADLVIVGSYVPKGAVVAEWVTRISRGVTAFYDIDTPVTLAGLENSSVDYISPTLIPRFDLYLSFTGGPVLDRIEQVYGSPRARALYCAVDPDVHAPVKTEQQWALGYLGTYSADRQPTLRKLLLTPALQQPDKAFVVAGPQYPDDVRWPSNVERIQHLPPDEHPEFYCAQRYTLNLTRKDMVASGFSPSVRLFEAAACGVPIISDRWRGLDSCFLPGKEILIADRPADVLGILCEMPDERRRSIAAAARKRVLREHTADHRAQQLEVYYEEVVFKRGAATKARAEAEKLAPTRPSL